MPRNFDDEFTPKTTDRKFILAGEEFEWKWVHWRILSTWLDGDDVDGAEEEEGAEPKPLETPTVVSTMENVAARIVRYLPEEQQERFLATVHNEENGITIVQLNEIDNWLVESQTRRPTEQPARSASGRGRSAATSPAA